MFLTSQVCVVRSVHQRPMTDEYSISGTTFAPDGFIYDADGLQVISIFYSPINFWDFYSAKNLKTCIIEHKICFLQFGERKMLAFSRYIST